MFVEIEDGVIKRVLSSSHDISSETIFSVPDGFTGRKGYLRDYYDENFSLKTDNQLVSEGLKPEIRGVWYTSDGEPVQITSVWDDVSSLRRTPQEIIIAQ